MARHIVHKDDNPSSQAWTVLCGNKELHGPGSAIYVTHKTADKKRWAFNHDPTCGTCLLLAFAEPDTILCTDQW